jgi:putative N6-adenine-specific DNA methylase
MPRKGSGGAVRKEFPTPRPSTGSGPRGERVSPAIASTEKLFISCPLGLEKLVVKELEALGFTGTPQTGGVAVEAPVGTHRLLNLWLRTAGRILLRVAEVPAKGDLAKELAKVDVSSLVSKGVPFEVQGVGHQVRELEAAGLKAWKKFEPKAAPPMVPGIKRTFDGVRLQLRGDRGSVTVSVDTSGDNLHFRGYREEIGHAPLRETLAAGMLMLAGWDGRSTLWDIMCGSGTLVIEGALMATGKAPGAQRKFAFEKFGGQVAADFAALSRVKTPSGPAPAIIGSDLNAGSVGIARRNARRAGVDQLLRLERLDATKLTPVGGVTPGLIVANLPYGKRVGEVGDLPTLYRAVGDNLRRNFRGWRYAFLAAGFEDQLGLSPDSLHNIENGGLRCRLLVGRIS